MLNMRSWVKELIESDEKKPLPLLSFPSVQLMDAKVSDLVRSSDLQAKGLALLSERVDMAAAVSFMDLSVEAEAFGAKLRYLDNEVPAVLGAMISDEDEADELEVPSVGAGRTGLYVEAVSRAVSAVGDKPLLAGVIGPFSLAGRLMDVSEAMIYCYEEPDMVHVVLRKASDFLIEYCKAYKAAGANGVFIAEPLAGLLSPAMAQEFSHSYVKEIVDAVQDDNFAVFYHNCGDKVHLMKEDLYAMGAMAYHFGDAINMTEMLAAAPEDVLVMGNVSPAGQLRGGTPESVREAVQELRSSCGSWKNFVLSSGCDIPFDTPWENIDAFFEAARD